MKNIFSQPIYFCFFVRFLCFPIQAQQVSKISDVKAGISSSRLERYEDFLKREIEEGKIPGAVSYVFRRGQLVHEAAFGYSDVDQKTPMQKDQIFYIQSMTKPIISVALLMLYEEGHFQLNDPVAKYLPAFKDMKVLVDPSKGLESETVELESPITIKQLFTHTAGFTHGLSGSSSD